MSTEVLSQKLDSIAQCLTRLSAKTPATVESLKTDIDLQDIVMINLERLVQISVDCASLLISERGWTPVPSSMAESFEVLFRKGVISEEIRERMQKAVGFRNLCVHEYDKINWEIVYRILTHHLDDFRRYAAAIDAVSPLS